MKILVTGANGLVGQYLVHKLYQQRYSVIATGKGASRLDLEHNTQFRYLTLDITDDNALHHVMEQERPDIIVHAAAMTQPDECEIQQDACFQVNVEGTANMLVYAEQYSKHFIYVSTDFVFDGKKGNYKEDDVLNPLSWYGFSKVQAEATVETSEIPFAIVRTCLVYGNPLAGTRRNIMTWVKSSIMNGLPIKVVNDQIRTPTYVEDLVDGLLLIIQKQATGIFHISGKDMLTPYQMAMMTADFLKIDSKLIEQVDASTFSQPARRPLKTGFDIGKARKILGFEPIDFTEGLRKTLGGG